MQFRFASPAFPNGLTCDYNSVGTDRNINVYFTPDVSAPTKPETIAIKSLILYGNRYRSRSEYSIMTYPNLNAKYVEMGVFETGAIDNNEKVLYDGVIGGDNDDKDLINYYEIAIGLLIACIIGMIMVGISLYKYYKKDKEFVSTETDPLLVSMQTN